MAWHMGGSDRTDLLEMPCRDASCVGLEEGAGEPDKAWLISLVSDPGQRC